MNIDEWPEDLEEAEGLVLRMQAKLHMWATRDSGRVFDDLFNLVYDPAFLVHAWHRVRSNQGGRTAGVDGQVPKRLPRYAVEFLMELRERVKDGSFAPLPVKERLIPKPGSVKQRRLGIPVMADRVVQAAVKLVLEPVFEADFKPVSHGFRPRRRVQDAIADIHALGSKGYLWVFEADIAACFDEIDHTALMGRVRSRVKDKRILGLVKSFLKAGVLSEDQVIRSTDTGTPQGGILSPLLANIALSVLDEHFHVKWEALGSRGATSDQRRRNHRRHGGATYKLVRYADDFVVLVLGTRAQAEALWDETAQVLAPMGLRLSEEKTRICHMDEGFDFLGRHIQRRTKAGTDRRVIYTYPSKKALKSITSKIRDITHGAGHRTLGDLLRHLNSVVRGWCHQFRHDVSSKTFGYIQHFMWRRVTLWLRKRHPKLTWKQMRRRYLYGKPGWRPVEGKIEMFHPQEVPVKRYRRRSTKIPTPWDLWINHWTHPEQLHA